MEYRKFGKREVFTSEDYDTFQRKLFSDDTTEEELQAVCMRLGRTPSAEAQELLITFRESDRAAEVKWLDLAIDEGRLLFLEPVNDGEERDYVALKVVREMTAEIIQLEELYRSDHLLSLKMAIENQATFDLIKSGELEEEEKEGLVEAQQAFQERAINHRREMGKKEKVLARVRESITTERYRDLDDDDFWRLDFV